MVKFYKTLLNFLCTNSIMAPLKVQSTTDYTRDFLVFDYCGL